MSEKDLRSYYEVYTDCWKFLRKYMELIEKVDSKEPPTEGMIDSDSYWEALVNESAELYEKHGNTLFVKTELINATKEIEKIYKTKKEQ